MCTLLFLLACGTPDEVPPPAEEPVEEPAPVEAPPWPAEGAALEILEPAFPEGFGKKKIYLDPGHGAAGSTGNTGVYCQLEQDVTLEHSMRLKQALEETGHFEVRMAREGDASPSYAERIREANAWADAYVSLHTDNREADAVGTWTHEGRECPRLDDHAGFSILWADNTGTEPLYDARRQLARDLAEHMIEAGFVPYDGEEYEEKWGADPDSPGVFVDRHVPEQRIFVLRKTTVPGVIIETHHAWYEDEVQRWREDRTHEAFAQAVIAGLIDALEEERTAQR